MIIACDFMFFHNYNGNSIFGTVGLGFSLFLAFTFAVMNFYIWTLMITFNFTTTQLYKNSFKFVFLNLWKNALCLILEVLMYAVYALVGYIILHMSANIVMMLLAVTMIVFVLTFPCYRALMIQYFVFPPIKKFIIEPYYKAHPFEDIEKRRDLGLEIEELKRYDEDGNLITDDEELVFDDTVN